MSKKIYYARHMALYGTAQDLRDKAMLISLGFDIVDPSGYEFQEAAKTRGMDVFIEAVEKCDGVAFRSFPDGKIGAGVAKEVERAIEMGKIVFELPTITSSRILTVEDTRTYLKLLGQR